VVAQFEVMSRNFWNFHLQMISETSSMTKEMLNVRLEYLKGKSVRSMLDLQTISV